MHQLCNLPIDIGMVNVSAVWFFIKLKHPIKSFGAVLFSNYKGLIASTLELSYCAVGSYLLVVDNHPCAYL